MRSIRTPFGVSSGSTRVSWTKATGSATASRIRRLIWSTVFGIASSSTATVTSTSTVARGSPHTALAIPPITM